MEWGLRLYGGAAPEQGGEAVLDHQMLRAHTPFNVRLCMQKFLFKLNG